jgi:hypothetical protein
MSDTTNIGGESLFVGATAEVFLDESGNPVAVSKATPLPTFTQGFQIPPHNDIEITNSDVNGTQKPTYMTFRLNGTPVFYLMLSYDGNGNLTRVQPD